MASAFSQHPSGSRSLFPAERGFRNSKSEFLGNSRYLKVGAWGIILHEGSIFMTSEKVLCRQVAALPDVGDFFWEKDPTPILDMVDTPFHLKNLSRKELKQLASEIRSEISFIISKSRRSVKSSLAAVELTIAVHYVFNAPVDQILWDVGEQTYAHKVLTGRRSLMHTLKRKNGLSGFTSRTESEYDAFGAAHGCNSVSAGLGMAVARDISGKKNHIVTIISNWTTMADEGPSMTINAISSTLSKVQSSRTFRRLREAAKGVTKRIGKSMHELAAKVDEYARGMIGPPGATLFEELGMYYIGPVDGHNIDDLICILNEVASMDSTGPVLIHVITKDEKASEDTRKSQMTSDQQVTSTSSSLASDISFVESSLSRTYNDCLAEALVVEAERDKEIVVVHAGMDVDPSLKIFQSRFPERFFDVGMAEQHAVTFAAGLASGGLKPFAIIPSTFLQRAYDQVIQDVDLQRVPVRFVITSAGLVGSDGPIQCGAFDITFMACLPNMIVMAPSDEDELVDMVATASCVNDRPVCFRYPRGIIVGFNGPLDPGTPIEIGKGELLVEGRGVALLGYGVMVQNCLKAQSLLSSLGIHVTVANARFCKPLDIELIRALCREHEFLITVEEGTIGGFGSHVSQFIALDGLLDGRIKWRPIVLPDNYIEHASPKEQLEMAGLTGHQIAATTLNLLGRHREALFFMR